MKHWTIYCHTHIDSGRRYIGLTSQTMEKRWKNHVHAAVSSKNGRWHFPNAIRKYGKDAFSHEVLQICNSLEEANLSEEKWIEYFDSRNPEKGFNLMKGGTHVPYLTRKNPWDDPEFRAKCTEANRRRMKDPDILKRIQESNIIAKAKPEEKLRSSLASKQMWQRSEFRERVSFLSKSAHSKLEVREKNSKAHLGKKLSPEHIKNSAAAHKGKKMKPEVYAKLYSPERRAMASAHFMGKKHSPETIAKLSGRVISPETRAKISAKLLGTRLK